MPLVAPAYLCESSLPYASDVFYHDHIVYCLPTGFHPLEIQNVAEFPAYCDEHSVTLPKVVWEFCNLYFENSKTALSCLNILEELRKSRVVVVATVYPRDRAAIDRARILLKRHPVLAEALRQVDLDMRFVSREVLSHVLFEIFLEEGYSGAIEYFRDNSMTAEAFLELVTAILVNRLKLFCVDDSELLVYEHSWYPAIATLLSIQSNSQYEHTDSDRVEHFRYKLFESILLPIFGRCDTRKKVETISKLAEKAAGSIVALKAACEMIAREVVLMPTTDLTLRQKALTQGINVHIQEPLSELVRKPKRDLLRLLRDFSLDSTVIGGLLAMTEVSAASTVGLALAAGALSTGIKYLLNERQHRQEPPTKLLVAGMRSAGIEEEALRRHLQEIALNTLQLPGGWENFGRLI